MISKQVRFRGDDLVTYDLSLVTVFFAHIAQLGEPAKAEAQLRPGERRDRRSRPVMRERQLRARDGHVLNLTQPV